MSRIDNKLHWTTLLSEKVLLGIIGGLTVIAAGQHIWGMWLTQYVCILYTSDAADERSNVDSGGRSIIKKKKTRR